MSFLASIFEPDTTIINEKNSTTSRIEVDINTKVDDVEDINLIKQFNRKEIAGSKFQNNNNTNIIDQESHDREINYKLKNDPLFTLKSQMIHKRNHILLNEHKMQKLKKEIIFKQKKKKRKKKKRKKKNHKIKQLLLQSLPTQSSSHSSSSSKSYKISNHRKHDRNRNKKRKYSSISNDSESDSHLKIKKRRRNESVSESVSIRNSKNSQRYGLMIDNKRHMTNVMVNDEKFQLSRNEILQKRNQNSSKIKTNKNRNQNQNRRQVRRTYDGYSQPKSNELLLKQMMSNAQEIKEKRNERISVNENNIRLLKKKYKEQENKDNEYLETMKSRLYLNSNDSLQSRLNKNVVNKIKTYL